MSKTKQTMVVETITPQQAKQILDANQQNYRKPKPRHVFKLAADMQTNRFLLDGNALKFNGDGRLLDGQHRLLACIASGKPFQTWVLRGLESDVTLDQGVLRTLSDALRNEGVPSSVGMSTVLNIINRWDAKERVVVTRALRPALSASAGLALYRKLKGISEMYREATNFKSVDVGAPSFICSMRWILDQVGPDRSSVFVTSFVLGTNVSEGHPIFALRRRFMQANKKKGSGFYELERFALVAKAWNAFLNEERMSQVTWKYVEAFPPFAES